MAAVATNPAVAKKTKIPQSVGKEFMEADKGKKFKGGGEMKESKEMVKKEIGFMKKKGAPKSMIKHEMKEAGMKKMASGGLAAGHKSADGIAHKGKTKGKEVKMAMGGFALNAVRNAAAAKADPMLQKAKQAAAKPPARTQQQSNADAARAYSNYKPSTTIAGGSMPPSRTTLLGGSMKPSGVAKMPMVPGTQRGGAMKPPTGGMMGAGQRGIGSQMASKPQMGGVNSALKKVGTTVSRAVMGRKAGGLAAGHKEADGIAKKGKTRAMQVKMAGGGKTKKYC
jgi:hypothetical protein